MEKRKLRENRTQWRQDAERAGIGSKTLQDVELNSASKILEKQFLLLKVLWRNNEARDFDPKLFDLSDSIEEARKVLRDYDDWN